MRPIATILALIACCAAPLAAGDDATKGKHPRKAELLQKFDANHDGKLDEGERAAARAFVSQKLKEKHPQLFAKADADGNGELSKEELQALREKAKAHRAEKGNGTKQGGEGKAGKAAQ
jgi:hypothetical protein